MGIKNKICFLKRSDFLKLLFFSALVLCSGTVIALLQAANPSEPVPPNGKQPDSISVSQSNEARIENKTGFADFLAIYHSYSQTKLEDKKLKEKGRELQEEINVDRDKISELEKKLNSGILSEKEKEVLDKEIEELKKQIARKIQEFNSKIDSERRQAIDKLIEELRLKISEYGKEKGYAMIFDQNELIFSDTRFDLTQEIIDYVNKNGKE